MSREFLSTNRKDPLPRPPDGAVVCEDGSYEIKWGKTKVSLIVRPNNMGWAHIVSNDDEKLTGPTQHAWNSFTIVEGKPCEETLIDLGQKAAEELHKNP